MRVALTVLVLALTIYALLDCARTPDESMPARMPKLLWVVIIVMVTGVGPIAWIIVSRVKAAEERGGAVEPTVWSSREGTSFHRPDRARPVAPDDDPDFLRGLEEDIRRQRREQDGGRGGEGASDDGDGDGDGGADDVDGDAPQAPSA
ncbi:PLD nuclease N-terminal domain-containing protein [Actinomyces radicidentis]|uniref:PLD nuclease N-terminal domain-containing protein n=1 Tax=Actinomyces radicidentis TaxID=111015 RepID=UPI0026E07F0F|nr:PLD nuclease N-terminal domain-containing protein [Actinomyces radicidentis]